MELNKNDEGQDFIEALRSLPPELLDALMQRDVTALQEIIMSLPAGDMQEVMARMKPFFEMPKEDLMQNMINHVVKLREPVLIEMAKVALGDETYKDVMEQELDWTEEKMGYRIHEPVHRIWAGERNVFALTKDLEQPEERGMVLRILEILGSVERSGGEDAGSEEG